MMLLGVSTTRKAEPESSILAQLAVVDTEQMQAGQDGPAVELVRSVKW